MDRGSGSDSSSLSRSRSPKRKGCSKGSRRPVPEGPPPAEPIPTTPIKAFDEIPVLALTPEWMTSMEGRELLRTATCYLMALHYVIRYHPQVWEEILTLPVFDQTGEAPTRQK